MPLKPIHHKYMIIIKVTGSLKVDVYITQGAKLYVCWQTDMASYKNVSYVE